MSLADELLADLDDLDEFDDNNGDGEGVNDEEGIDDGMDTESGPRVDDETRVSAEVSQVLQRIASSPRIETGSVLTSDDEAFIVRANALLSAIDGARMATHSTLRGLYSSRFPELESLVGGAAAYARVVSILRNSPENAASLSDELGKVLPPTTFMVVTVTAATSGGAPLNEVLLAAVDACCATANYLEDASTRILAFVETRLHLLAPNVCVILGASTAANLVGAAGGLSALSRIAACNILVLGQPKGKASVGLSLLGSAKHRGLIYACSLVQEAPQDLRRRAARLVAAKTVLAARIDTARSRPDGSLGEVFRADIIAKLEKAMAPPPAANTRALPAPDDAPKKRRGGKKARKAKDAYAMSEMRKAQNRVKFGAQEADVLGMDESEGLGLLGQPMTGKVRGFAQDLRTKSMIFYS